MRKVLEPGQLWALGHTADACDSERSLWLSMNGPGAAPLHTPRGTSVPWLRDGLTWHRLPARPPSAGAQNTAVGPRLPTPECSRWRQAFPIEKLPSPGSGVGSGLRRGPSFPGLSGARASPRPPPFPSAACSPAFPGGPGSGPQSSAGPGPSRL